MRNAISEFAISTGAAMRDKASAESMLEELYDRYARSLYRFALSILGSPEDAEDAIQEVFIRVARDCKRLNRVENTKAYLFTSVRNAAYSILRSRQRGERLEETVLSEWSLAPSIEDASARSMTIQRALAELPIEQRETLVLKVYGELTFKEIADLAGDSINTVYARYRYALEKMKHALGED